jgi:hypothetical protein
VSFGGVEKVLRAQSTVHGDGERRVGTGKEGEKLEGTKRHEKKFLVGDMNRSGKVLRT